jgi:putative transposase
MYLVAIIDWFSRKVLAFSVSNTLDASFCVETLKEALERHGRPEIFNTEKGSQFTDSDFTGVLKTAGVQLSMDGRGRCQDNISSRGFGEASSTCTSIATQSKADLICLMD